MRGFIRKKLRNPLRTAVIVAFFVLFSVAVSGVFAAEGSSADRNGALVFQAGVGCGYPGPSGSIAMRLRRQLHRGCKRYHLGILRRRT